MRIAGIVGKDEILIATTNAGKLREIVRMLDGLPITLKTLANFPHAAVADETGSSFSDNARQKALHYAGITGMLTMAEDSGFEVAALNGEPGIYSARYLRADAGYDERFAHIYQKLRDSASSDRSARFVCAVAVAHHGDVLFERTATVEGLLAEKPAGSNGFGYDPIFLYPDCGKTFGEVSDDEKTAVSHRGQAMRAFREYLRIRLRS
ncbi:MAG: RdgB/HAM1 family non-canonical purine NTP pyrophosphatase [Vicinamibacterales bacterium]